MIATNRSTQLATIAIFTTTQTMRLDSTRGSVGKTVGVALTGFAANEKIAVRDTRTGSTSVLLATLTANAVGSATGSAAVPPSTFGSQKIEAKGVSSKKIATGAYNVNPAIALKLNSAGVGARVGIALR